MIQNASDIILVVDRAGVVTYCTPSVERILGWAVADIERQQMRWLLPPDDVAAADQLLIAASSGEPATVDMRLRGVDGLLRSFEVLVNDLFDDPDVAGLVLTMRDVSERRALEERLKYQAFHDGLTGLANRALFYDRAGHALATTGRVDRSIAMAILDLDDFKVVNDTHGHAIGDLLLQEVADRITAGLRPGDTAARLGGDEFAVLLEDVADVAGVEAAVHRMLAALNAPFHIQGELLFANASAGVVVADSAREFTAVSEMLRRADLAMYSAKERGKNGSVTYHPDLHSKVVDRVVLKSQLQAALDSDEFILNYQPIVVLATGEITGAEALLRWQRPGQQILLPWDFVPLAEETGLIVPLGRWVLDQACAQAQRWSVELGRPMGVSVNVSAVQLHEPGFVNDVRDALERYKLPASSLYLELTESLLVDDGTATPHRLQELRDLHIQLAIDDFGTGYSSLGYLRRFPIDILKIDKLFVDGLGTGTDDDGTLARAIVSLAGALRLQVVAEGVENLDQRNELIELGCIWGQGYLYSKPVGALELSAMLGAGGHLGPIDASTPRRPVPA